MFSNPPTTATSEYPSYIPIDPTAILFIPDAHTLFIVVHGTF